MCKIQRDFQKLFCEKKFDIDFMISHGTIDEKVQIRTLICYYFNELKQKVGVMQAFTELSEKYCMSEAAIQKIIYKKVIIK